MTQEEYKNANALGLEFMDLYYKEVKKNSYFNLDEFIDKCNNNKK